MCLCPFFGWQRSLLPGEFPPSIASSWASMGDIAQTLCREFSPLAQTENPIRRSRQQIETPRRVVHRRPGYCEERPGVRQ
jgi:hypothetical protein